jgi:DNA repair exonuclease SbcCD ATPase subunit
MITLKTLRWSDCFSYGPDNYIDLNEHTITQIVGLNGAGKSSIPLIIEEVLFSKNSKGVKKADIANRNTDNGGSYSISLEFSVDDKEYEVSISRKSTLKVKLTEGGVDISSHTATNTFKTVLDLLGMDFKTMSQLFYQNTNASLQFLTATDTNRKRFLIDLLHLEEYLELFEIFKEAVKDVSSKVIAAESSMSTVQKWLDTNKLSATEVLPLLEIDLNTSKDEMLLSDITSDLKNISAKNRLISINNDMKKRISNIDINAVNSTEACEHISHDSELTQLGASKSELSRVQTYVSKMASLGDKCPTCNQTIPSEFKEGLIQEAQANLTSLTTRIKELETRVSEIKTNNAEYAKKVAVKKEWEDTFRSIDNGLPSELLVKDEHEKMLEEVTNRIAETRKTIARLTEENNSRIKANTRKQVIEEQTEVFKLELAKAVSILDTESDRLSKLEILKKSFSTNGLIAYKIENLVKELEQLTNDYLAELSDGRFTIEFVVLNDKLNVEVTDFGKVVDILALSSGELARVNTSTLLALRKLMNSISKSSLNVLFLDEVINVLDEDGKERLVEVLLEEDLNIFIVSHNWTHPLLAKLIITKDSNGVSYIGRN